MSNYTLALDLLKESVTNIEIFGISFIIPIVLVLFTTVLITRDTKMWLILPLPIATLYSIMGLNFPPMFWLIIAITFAIAILTNDSIVNLAKSIVTIKSRREDRIETETITKAKKRRNVMRSKDILNKTISGIQAQRKLGVGEKEDKKLFKEETAIQKLGQRVGVVGWSDIPKLEKRLKAQQKAEAEENAKIQRAKEIYEELKRKAGK